MFDPTLSTDAQAVYVVECRDLVCGCRGRPDARQSSAEKAASNSASVCQASSRPPNGSEFALPRVHGDQDSPLPQPPCDAATPGDWARRGNSAVAVVAIADSSRSSRMSVELRSRMLVSMTLSPAGG